MYDLIKELSEMSGPVGQEGPVLERMETLWREAGARVERTRIGNVLGRVGATGPKLLMAAHADELCYLVRAIDPRGFLWLANGQAWQRTTSFSNAFTIGQRVRVLARSGEIPGVIGSITGHVATLSQPEPRELNWYDFWVDTGLSARELQVAGVTPGTRVIWEATTERFGPHVVGKALDDRACLAILTEVIRQVPAEEMKWQLTLACTVQEEIGLVGAYAAGNREEFDAAIVVEIGLAGDIPGVGETMMPVHLGGGPILVHKDAQVHYDYNLTAALEQTAAENDIPIQHAVFGSFGSDGGALMKSDIPSALVAFPARYTHTPFETAHLGDMEHLVAWLCAFVKR
ncbi:MAG: M20/M25/M40 family metallo-hydrolase [Chloroflexi bacterium]|nr:MAG: M20/M25/M40 family metallo-hydrolase [Chloroflexota bacterium]